jgi:putative flippase GtrA
VSVFLLNPFSILGYAILVIGAFELTRRRCYEQSEEVETKKAIVVFLTTLVTMTLFAVVLAAAILGLLLLLNDHSTPIDSRSGWFPGVVLFLFGSVVCFLLGTIGSRFVGSRVSRLFWKREPIDEQNPASGE